MSINGNSVTAGVIPQKSYEKTAFDSILILTDKATFEEDYRIYQSSTAFLADNLDVELQAVGTLLFAQEPKVKTVILAKTDPANIDLGALSVRMVELDSVVTDDFFAVGVVSAHTNEQLVALATYIETLDKLCFLYSNDIGVISATTTDLAFLVKDLGLRQTFVSYHADIRKDMALISRFLGESIGLVSAKHLVLSGVTPSNLSSSELSNLFSKNANCYDRERKKFIFTKQGTTASNEDIKSVAGEIFIKISTMESIYEILLNNSNISFNTKDLNKLNVAIRQRLKIAQTQKIIAETSPIYGDGFIIEVNAIRAENKIEFTVKYLDAGTLKWVTLTFVAFKDDTQFTLESEA